MSSAFPRALFRHEYLDDEIGARARFVDGGVLDNAPFDLAIDAVGNRKAQTEVLRRLVYVQPDPGRKLYEQNAELEPAEPGGADLWRVASEVRGSHPILEQLLALRDMNLHIAQINAIAEQQMSEVSTEIARSVTLLLGATPAGQRGDWSERLPDIDNKDRVQAISDDMHKRAAAALGHAWGTYERLKVEAAGRRLADEVAQRFEYPPRSSRASFVRAAIGALARMQPEWKDTPRLQELLGAVDIPYRERRLMFLLAGVNQLYEQAPTSDPIRRDLNAIKTRAWELLDMLHKLPGALVKDAKFDFLTGQESEDWILRRPEAFAKEHDGEFRSQFTSYREKLATNLDNDSTSSGWRSRSTPRVGNASQERSSSRDISDSRCGMA